jgi:hypothetical protein
LLLKRTVLKGKAQAFLLELPTYKWPSLRTVFHRVYEQGREFCISAGTIIFAVAIVIWALGYYPRPAAIAAEHDAQRATAEAEYAADLTGKSTSLGAGAHPAALFEDPAIAPLIAELETMEAEIEDENPADSVQAAKLEFLARNPKNGPVALGLFEARRQRAKKLDEIDRDQAGAYLRQSFLAWAAWGSSSNQWCGRSAGIGESAPRSSPHFPPVRLSSPP